MRKDVVDDRSGIVQRVGVMSDPLLHDDVQMSAELFVALLQNGRVLFDGNSQIGVADDMKDRNLRPRDRRQDVDGAAGKGERSFFVQAVDFLKQSPVLR